MKYYFIVIAFLLSACGSQETKKTLSIAPEAKPTFENFCYQLADSFNAKDTSLFKTSFDLNLMYKQSFGNMNSTAPTTQPNKENTNKLINASLNTTSKNLIRSDQWYVISSQDQGNNSRCHLHSNLSDAGLFIISIYMRKDKSGQIFLTNWYDHQKAALATTQLKEVMRDASHAFIDSEEETPENVSRLLAFYNAVKNSDAKQAWETYNTLDKKILQKKIHLTSLLQATALNPEYLNKAIELYLEHVNEKDYGAFLIDHFIETKAFDAAFNLIDKIAKNQGSSAITELLRAHIYLAMGNKKNFYQFIYKSMDYNYDLEDIYWSLLEQFIVDKHYKNAVLTLDVLVQNFGYIFTQDMFIEHTEYHDFATGDVYKTWLEQSF